MDRSIDKSIDNIRRTSGYSMLRTFYKSSLQRKYLKDINRAKVYTDRDLRNVFHKVTGRVEEYAACMFSADSMGKFAASSNGRCIYSYVYLSMLYGLLGEENVDEALNEALKKILTDSQAEDGLFYDKNVMNYQYVIGDGWGARHLAIHMIIAMQYLDIKPVHPFRFLDAFMDYDTMYSVMDALDWKKVWSTSNFVMNVGCSLQYARDYMDKTEAAEPVRAIEDWLTAHIREDSGMWFDGRITSKTIKYEMVRGAYHLYPILLYDKIGIPYKEKGIDVILSLQNGYGGFDFRKNSSACEDIDATDSLIWLSGGNRGYKRSEVENCLRNAFFWIVQNQMEDGGFVFRRGEAFDYGHSNMSSGVDESNLFATWFRFLSLCHIHDFIAGGEHDYGNVPGLHILYHCMV